MSNFIIGQYFYIADEPPRTWAIKFQPDIPYANLTRLYIAFAWLNNGLLTYANTTDNPTDQQRIADLAGACRAANPSAEIFITSGYDQTGAMYKLAAQNPTAFANSVVAFLRGNNLDGYDMDWENGIGGNDLDTLLKATRSALDTAGRQDGKRYGLTMATWPSPYGRGYNMQNFPGEVDQINLMSYGTYDPMTGDVGEWTQAGMPIAQIIGGIETENGYSGGQDTLGPTGSIAAKATYAWQNGMAGMMEWRLDNDYVNTTTQLSTYQGAMQLYQSSPVPVYLYTAQNPPRYYYTLAPLDTPGAGWSYAGVAFTAFNAGIASGNTNVVAVNRHSAPGPQRYSYGTTTAVAPGWTNDNVVPFYAFAAQVPGTVPVYVHHQLLPGSYWNMFYSLNANESGWISDGVAFYVCGT